MLSTNSNGFENFGRVTLADLLSEFEDLCASIPLSEQYQSSDSHKEGNGENENSFPGILNSDGIKFTSKEDGLIPYPEEPDDEISKEFRYSEEDTEDSTDSCQEKYKLSVTSGVHLMSHKILSPIPEGSDSDKTLSSSKVKSSSNRQDTLMAFLLERLESSFFPKLYARQTSSDRKRGRPRVVKDINVDTIWNEVLEKLSTKANGRKIQRTDAKNASICRDAKRVVDHMLKYLGSKCRYKSTKDTDVIESYAEAFTIGFVPTIFEGEALENKVKTFCEFITIAYPEKKVKSILSMITEAGFLTPDERDIFIHQIEQRKSSSKISFLNLLRQNRCFKKIFLKLLSKLDQTTLEDKESYKRTLSSFISPTA
ncbi:unnamed protein product [Moneuplotes crassus]|uniref:Uncharacterized protein n=1 Tax=Euplotes crassus TaxID=5936 RepID=A0AAD1UST8_EUPCR|nr:unnamed protein product [Moneuplotes crassus]